MRDNGMNPTAQTQPAIAGNSTPDKVFARGQAKDVSDARKKLVSQIQADIKTAAKKYEDGPFKRMREDMNFAFLGCSEKWHKEDKYVVNLVQSHIRQKTATLYAKNPKAIAQPLKKLMFQMWDGDVSQVTQAIQSMMVNPMDQQSMMLLQDVAQGVAAKKQVEKLGETLEIVYSYFQNEQQPDFKGQMKQAVVRAITAGIAYIEVGFQRAMGPSPIVERKLSDYKTRLDHLAAMNADIKDNVQSYDIDTLTEEYTIAMNALQNEPEIILREGLVFDFPKSTSIIPDLRCTQLKGWIGARRVTKQMFMSVEDIKRLYQVDISGGYTPYKASSGNNFQEMNATAITGGSKNGQDLDSGLVKFWLCYDKQDGLVYALAEGYNDFLTEPAAPDVKIEQFFPWFPLAFNALESEKEIFPTSDVRLIRHQQNEMNRSRQELVMHRRAARPKYATPMGMLEESDVNKLKNCESSAVLALRGLKPGQKVTDLIQAIETKGVDPNLYDTSQVFEDVMHVVGAQEANLGGTNTGDTTATESSIAETARMSSVGAAGDELDDLLTVIARTGGQICMHELSAQTVMEIAGPGAFWPTMAISQIQKELNLRIEAGSSGRPNRALELQNIQQIMPFLLQLPGVSHEWILRELIKRMDDRMDIDEALLSGMPSIIAQNAAAGAQANQGPAANPMNTPGNQGVARGGSNLIAPKAAPTGQKTGAPAPVGA